MSFIDHLVFRVSDLARSETFYSKLFDQAPARAEQSIMYLAGDTRVFFTVPLMPPTRSFDKEDIGLNHLAFGIRTIDELKTIATRLSAADLVHSGITIDPYGEKEFIWLDDPDGMRVEFYLRD